MKHTHVLYWRIWPFDLCTCPCVRFSPTLGGYFRCPRNTDVPVYCFKPPGRVIFFLTYATLMILQYFSSHALFWCSPKIHFFLLFPKHAATQFFWVLGTQGRFTEEWNDKFRKAYYLISGSHSDFTDKFYYQSCTFKFFFTKKETISLQLNSINHEETRRFLKPLEFVRKKS